MAALDLLVTAAIIIAAVVALWDRWRFFQFVIFCAVVETDYFWHWSPPHSLLAPLAGLVAALLLTGLFSGEFSRTARQRRRNDPLPLWLRRLRQPS